MKNVSILIPKRIILETVGGTYYLFKVVNSFLQASGKKPLFNVQLVGLTKEIKLENNLFSVHPILLKDVKKMDLIIIPSLSGDVNTALKANKKLLPWIIEQYKNGAELASLCLGSFLLAATGLLTGKKCSTHWSYVNEFRSMFPDIDLVDDTIITDQHGIYSSGGANSYWNLLLYLIEKYIDRNTAVITSKFFAIDIDRENQSAFIMFEGQRNHEDLLILKMQKYIEDNFQSGIKIDDLVRQVAIGRRSFERRFKKATHNTVGEYIQRIKIEAAKKILEDPQKKIKDVMVDIGFKDKKAFRVMFKKITGLTPIEYQRKYNKEAIL